MLTPLLAILAIKQVEIFDIFVYPCTISIAVPSRVNSNNKNDKGNNNDNNKDNNRDDYKDNNQQ